MDADLRMKYDNDGHLLIFIYQKVSQMVYCCNSVISFIIIQSFLVHFLFFSTMDSPLNFKVLNIDLFLALH